MRSSNAVFKKLPRDSSSKSLVISIEDVSKNLEANSQNLAMEYDLSNVDDLIKEILHRISVNKSLKSQIKSNQKELEEEANIDIVDDTELEDIHEDLVKEILKRIAINKSLESKISSNRNVLEETTIEFAAETESEKNHFILDNSSEAELGEIFKEIQDEDTKDLKEEAVEDPDVLQETELKFIRDTIESIRRTEEKSGIKNTSKYYFKDKQIYPDPSQTDSPNRQADVDNKKVRFEDDSEQSSPLPKKRREKKSLDDIKFKINNPDELPNYDKFVKVNETDSYVEFTKEPKESYDPNKFVQVEWDDELLTLNADIYNSIKKKKVCLERRESSKPNASSKASELLLARGESPTNIEETREGPVDPTRPPRQTQTQPVVKYKGTMGKIKSIFKRRKNKVSPPQENTKEIFADSKYKKKFRMENIKKK